LSSEDKPHNYPLYSINSDLDSFILYNDGDINNQVINTETEISKMDLTQSQLTELNTPPKHLWNMSFDVSCSKDGARAGIWVVNIGNNHVEGQSYWLNFQCTNNIAEY